MLELFVLIPIAFIILNIRIRIIKNIIINNDDKKIIPITLIMGIISGLSIVVYPHFLELINFSKFDFSNKSNEINNFYVFFAIWLYISSVIIISKIIIGNFKIKKFFIINFTIFTIIFLFFGYFQETFISLERFLIYYTLVSLGEEYIKYMIGINFFEKRKISHSDMIIFAILSAIGFAFIENIVYMLNTITDENIFQALIFGTSVLIARGIIGFLAHIIFTGNIGLIGGVGEDKKYFLFFITIGIIIGVLLHFFYNTLLHLDMKYIILVLIIIGYFRLTYLFYKSDRIYVGDGLNY